MESRYTVETSVCLLWALRASRDDVAAVLKTAGLTEFTDVLWEGR
jgi:hypothetical protein